jgi:hypothetical protein
MIEILTQRYLPKFLLFHILASHGTARTIARWWLKSLSGFFTFYQIRSIKPVFGEQPPRIHRDFQQHSNIRY